MLKKKRPTGFVSDEAMKRVNRLARPELYAWADNLLYVVGRSLSEYRKTGEEVFANEAHEAAKTLLAITSKVQSE